MSDKSTHLTRWRLVLGKYAKPRLGAPQSDDEARMAGALDALYEREYHGRGVRRPGAQRPQQLTGGLEGSQLTVPKWLAEVQELFPKETCERITQHALERYGMTELLTDAKTLAAVTPSIELLSAVLLLKGRHDPTTLSAVRTLITRVVEEIKRKLKQQIENTLVGQLNRFRHSQLKVARNFDARDTIRRNLKNWDPERRKIIVDLPRFFSRVRRHMAWEVILCVDQSGSMASSVIHTAVMGGILSGLPLVRVRLVIFDTSVVDLSEYASDPVEVLMSVQLGGGTNIGQAICYCEQLVQQPRRTVFVLVSDFCEGADPKVMYSAIKRLREGGVTLLGLAALDDQANPWYDKQVAARLSDLGMQIAALTPNQLAQWLAGVVNRG